MTGLRGPPGPPGVSDLILIIFLLSAGKRSALSNLMDGFNRVVKDNLDHQEKKDREDSQGL